MTGSKGDIVILWLLNLTSLGWLITVVMEVLTVLVASLVGLSIVFLNIAKGIHWLRKKKEKDEEVHE